MNSIQPAAFLVNPQGSLEPRVLRVWIRGKVLGEDDGVRVSAAHRERISDYGPLRFAPQAQNLAQIVDQAGQDEPARISIPADLLGGLQQMFELGKVRIGIAIID